MPEIRVRLGLEEYKDLVRGNVVEIGTPQGTVKIILADIGWEALANELAKAVREKRGD